MSSHEIHDRPLYPEPNGYLGATAMRLAMRLSGADLAKLVVVGLLRAVTTAASILIIRLVIDSVNTDGRLSAALQYAWIYIGLALGIALARGLEYTVAEKVGYRQVARLRMALHRHLLNLPVRNVQRSSQGAILLRFTGDLSTLRTWTSRGLARGIVSALTLVIVLGVVFFINWRIGLVVLGVLLLTAGVSIMWGYRVHRATRAVRWRRSLLASNVAEQIRSLGVVLAFGRSGGEHRRLGGQNDDLLGALNRAANARGGLRLITTAGGYLAVGAVMVAGIYQLRLGQVSVGGLVATMIAVRQLTGPVQTLGRSYEYWQAADVSRKKIADYMNRRVRLDAEFDLPPLRPRKGAVRFEGVYVDGALNGIDLAVEPRKVTAIMGPNGAGKSTLLSLVGRSLEPAHGAVFVDDQNLAETSVRSCARNIGTMSPDLPLMRGTIRRNLSYRYGKATDEQLQPAIMACRVDEIIESQEGGLSAWIVEGGTNLSEGHQQRLALARAVVGNPRILLLDEPTANMDPASKEVFRRFLWRYQGTVLFVTHDPAEAALADRVVTLSDGRVVADVDGDEFRLQLRSHNVPSGAGRSVQW